MLLILSQELNDGTELNLQIIQKLLVQYAGKNRKGIGWKGWLELFVKNDIASNAMLGILPNCSAVLKLNLRK